MDFRILDFVANVFPDVGTVKNVHSWSSPLRASGIDLKINPRSPETPAVPADQLGRERRVENTDTEQKTHRLVDNVDTADSETET